MSKRGRLADTRERVRLHAKIGISRPGEVSNVARRHGEIRVRSVRRSQVDVSSRIEREIPSASRLRGADGGDGSTAEDHGVAAGLIHFIAKCCIGASISVVGNLKKDYVWLIPVGRGFVVWNRTAMHDE